jgi:hypothetical protein
MKSKNTESAVITLLGFIKTKTAKLTGFHNPEEIPLSNWKIIPRLWWLKVEIAVGNVQTFLLGSSTDVNLCGKRWEYLIGKIQKHKELEPVRLTNPIDYKQWFDELVELEVQSSMTWHEMNYHRTGRQQYSYSRNDMSEEMAAAYPEWWFDGTRAKRKARELNAK